MLVIDHHFRSLFATNIFMNKSFDFDLLGALAEVPDLEAVHAAIIEWASVAALALSPAPLPQQATAHASFSFGGGLQHAGSSGDAVGAGGGATPPSFWPISRGGAPASSSGAVSNSTALPKHAHTTAGSSSSPIVMGADGGMESAGGGSVGGGGAPLRCRDVASATRIAGLDANAAVDYAGFRAVMVAHVPTFAAMAAAEAEAERRQRRLSAAIVVMEEGSGRGGGAGGAAEGESKYSGALTSAPPQRERRIGGSYAKYNVSGAANATAVNVSSNAAVAGSAAASRPSVAFPTAPTAPPSLSPLFSPAPAEARPMSMLDIFNQIDTDGDGRVSWEDIYTLAVDAAAGKLRPLPSDCLAPFSHSRTAERSDNVLMGFYLGPRATPAALHINNSSESLGIPSSTSSAAAPAPSPFSQRLVAVSSRHCPLQLLSADTLQPLASRHKPLIVDRAGLRRMAEIAFSPLPPTPVGGKGRYRSGGQWGGGGASSQNSGGGGGGGANSALSHVPSASAREVRLLSCDYSPHLDAVFAFFSDMKLRAWLLSGAKGQRFEVEPLACEFRVSQLRVTRVTLAPSSSSSSSVSSSAARGTTAQQFTPAPPTHRRSTGASSGFASAAVAASAKEIAASAAATSHGRPGRLFTADSGGFLTIYEISTDRDTIPTTAGGNSSGSVVVADGGSAADAMDVNTIPPSPSRVAAGGSSSHRPLGFVRPPPLPTLRVVDRFRLHSATEGGISHMCFITPLEQRVVTAGYDRTLKLLDLVTRRETVIGSELPCAPRLVAYSEASQSVVTVLLDNTVWLWVTHQSVGRPFSPLADPSLPHAAAIVGLEAPPGTSLIITTDSSGLAKVWDATTLACVQSMHVGGSGGPPADAAGAVGAAAAGGSAAAEAAAAASSASLNSTDGALSPFVLTSLLKGRRRAAATAAAQARGLAAASASAVPDSGNNLCEGEQLTTVSGTFYDTARRELVCLTSKGLIAHAYGKGTDAEVADDTAVTVASAYSAANHCFLTLSAGSLRVWEGRDLYLAAVRRGARQSLRELMARYEREQRQRLQQHSPSGAGGPHSVVAGGGVVGLVAPLLPSPTAAASTHSNPASAAALREFLARHTFADLTAFAIDATGRRVFLGYQNGDVEFQNFHGGTTVRRIPFHSAEVTRMAFCEAYRSLVSVSADGSLVVYREGGAGADGGGHGGGGSSGGDKHASPMTIVQLTKKANNADGNSGGEEGIVHSTGADTSASAAANAAVDPIVALAVSAPLRLIAAGTRSGRIILTDLRFPRQTVCEYAYVTREGSLRIAADGGSAAAVTGLCFLGEWPLLASTHASGDVAVWACRPLPIPNASAAAALLGANTSRRHVSGNTKHKGQRRGSASDLPQGMLHQVNYNAMLYRSGAPHAVTGAGLRGLGLAKGSSRNSRRRGGSPSAAGRNGRGGEDNSAAEGPRRRVSVGGKLLDRTLAALIESDEDEEAAEKKDEEVDGKKVARAVEEDPHAYLDGAHDAASIGKRRRLAEIPTPSCCAFDPSSHSLVLGDSLGYLSLVPLCPLLAGLKAVTCRYPDATAATLLPYTTNTTALAQNLGHPSASPLPLALEGAAVGAAAHAARSRSPRSGRATSPSSPTAARPLSIVAAAARGGSASPSPPPQIVFPPRLRSYHKRLMVAACAQAHSGGAVLSVEVAPHLEATTTAAGDPLCLQVGQSDRAAKKGGPKSPLKKQRNEKSDGKACGEGSNGLSAIFSPEASSAGASDKGPFSSAFSSFTNGRGGRGGDKPPSSFPSAAADSLPFGGVDKRKGANTDIGNASMPNTNNSSSDSGEDEEEIFDDSRVPCLIISCGEDSRVGLWRFAKNSAATVAIASADSPLPLSPLSSPKTKDGIEPADGSTAFVRSYSPPPPPPQQQILPPMPCESMALSLIGTLKMSTLPEWRRRTTKLVIPSAASTAANGPGRGGGRGVRDGSSFVNVVGGGGSTLGEALFGDGGDNSRPSDLNFPTATNTKTRAHRKSYAYPFAVDGGGDGTGAPLHPLPPFAEVDASAPPHSGTAAAAGGNGSSLLRQHHQPFFPRYCDHFAPPPPPRRNRSRSASVASSVGNQWTSAAATAPSSHPQAKQTSDQPPLSAHPPPERVGGGGGGGMRRVRSVGLIGVGDDAAADTHAKARRRQRGGGGGGEDAAAAFGAALATSDGPRWPAKVVNQSNVGGEEGDSPDSPSSPSDQWPAGGGLDFGTPTEEHVVADGRGGGTANADGSDVQEPLEAAGSAVLFSEGNSSDGEGDHGTVGGDGGDTLVRGRAARRVASGLSDEEGSTDGAVMRLLPPSSPPPQSAGGDGTAARRPLERTLSSLNFTAGSGLLLGRADSPTGAARGFHPLSTMASAQHSHHAPHSFTHQQHLQQHQRRRRSASVSSASTCSSYCSSFGEFDFGPRAFDRNNRNGNGNKIVGGGSLVTAAARTAALSLRKGVTAGEGSDTDDEGNHTGGSAHRPLSGANGRNGGGEGRSGGKGPSSPSLGASIGRRRRRRVRNADDLDASGWGGWAKGGSSSNAEGGGGGADDGLDIRCRFPVGHVGGGFSVYGMVSRGQQQQQQQHSPHRHSSHSNEKPARERAAAGRSSAAGGRAPPTSASRNPSPREDAPSPPSPLRRIFSGSAGSGAGGEATSLVSGQRGGAAPPQPPVTETETAFASLVGMAVVPQPPSATPIVGAYAAADSPTKIRKTATAANHNNGNRIGGMAAAAAPPLRYGIVQRNDDHLSTLYTMSSAGAARERGRLRRLSLSLGLIAPSTTEVATASAGAEGPAEGERSGQLANASFAAEGAESAVAPPSWVWPRPASNSPADAPLAGSVGRGGGASQLFQNQNHGEGEGDAAEASLMVRSGATPRAAGCAAKEAADAIDASACSSGSEVPAGVAAMLEVLLGRPVPAPVPEPLLVAVEERKLRTRYDKSATAAGGGGGGGGNGGAQRSLPARRGTASLRSAPVVGPSSSNAAPSNASFASCASASATPTTAAAVSEKEENGEGGDGIRGPAVALAPPDAFASESPPNNAAVGWSGKHATAESAQRRVSFATDVAVAGTHSAAATVGGDVPPSEAQPWEGLSSPTPTPTQAAVDPPAVSSTPQRRLSAAVPAVPPLPAGDGSARRSSGGRWAASSSTTAPFGAAPFGLGRATSPRLAPLSPRKHSLPETVGTPTPSPMALAMRAAQTARTTASSTPGPTVPSPPPIPSSAAWTQPQSLRAQSARLAGAVAVRGDEVPTTAVPNSVKRGASLGGSAAVGIHSRGVSPRAVLLDSKGGFGSSKLRRGSPRLQQMGSNGTPDRRSASGLGR